MVFIKKYAPFPGDLLLSQYGPWRHESYGGYAAGGVPSKDQYFDVIRELYPWKTLVIQELKKGNIPLWNPYNFSGSPLLANYQSQVFYPLTILYFIFPQVIAWTILVILQPLLGSVFLYLFATEIGISSAGAIISAILFNFSSFASVWMEFNTVWHTILWLPLLLFLVERGIKQKKLLLGQKLLFIFALFSSITGGHPQDFIYVFLAFISYAVIRLVCIRTWLIRQKVTYFFHHLFFVTAISFCLAAPQLFPTIELYKNSARVIHDHSFIINNLLIQMWQLPLVVVRDFYGNPATKTSIFGDYVLKTVSIGVVGFIFSVISLFSLKKSWHRSFFSTMTIVLFLLTVRTPFSEFIYRWPIPLLSTGSPTRILFLLALSLSVLTGMGYDEILIKKKIPLKALLCVWLIIAILWAIVVLHPTIGYIVFTPEHISTMKRSMVLTTCISLFLTLIIVSTRYLNTPLCLSIALCTCELYLSFIKFNPFVSTAFFFPQNKLIKYLQNNTGIYRVWGYGTAGMEANFATQEGLYSPDGTDPLNIATYNRFIQSSRDGNIAISFTRSTRSDAQLAPGYGITDLHQNNFRLRVMDMLGVKYIIDRSENPKDTGTFPEDRFKPVWHGNDWTVYENRKAAPRYFLTSDIRPYSDNPDFERQFFAHDFNFSSTILMETNTFKTLPVLAKTSGSATLLQYKPTLLKFETDTDTPTILFISDTYDPGWVASINGISSPIYKANFAFRAIPIPTGKSSIVLAYRPQSFTIGLKIAIIAVLILVWYLAYFVIKGKKKKSD